jgi:antigen flippase
MGGAQAVTLLTALFRTKLIAILIGPAGIGLMGLLNAFNANLWTVGAWGLNLSGVRMISSAPPEQRKTKEVAVRAMGRGLTFAGLILLILAVVPVGYMTFGSHEYSPLLFISGLAAPCMITSTASSVLLQSAGHIGSLARAQVTSGVIGFLLGIPAIYFFGELGIGISILLASAASAYATWKAARAYCPSGEAKANPDDIRELIKLGFALQLGGMLANASYYLTRILIIKHYPGDMQAGLDAAGYYQAAFALAGLMPGFIFSAMGAEFFPQVSAAASEHDARIITERQIRACLLLALPMLMAILTAGDWIMSLLYAQSFGKAVPLLPWFVWGIYGTLLSWPIVYWMMARGKKRNVIFIQTTAAILIGLTAAVLVPCFGIMGAAIGFCVSNTIYLCVMVVYARRQAGMWISNRTLRWFLFSGVSLGLGQLLDGLVSTVFLKLAPAFISTLICGAIYFKVMRSSEGKSQ